MAKSIYVADDELHIRNLIQTFLANEGYEVRTFADGDSLFQAFCERCPDLIRSADCCPEPAHPCGRLIPEFADACPWSRLIPASVGTHPPRPDRFPSQNPSRQFSRPDQCLRRSSFKSPVLPDRLRSPDRNILCRPGRPHLTGI